MLNLHSQRIKAFFSIKAVLLSLLLTVETVLVIDYIITFCFYFHFLSFLVPVIFLLVFVAYLAIIKYISKIILFAIGLVLPTVLILFYLGIYNPFVQSCSYENTNTHASVFCNKRVMVIVPHEDDEINLMSGVLESYVDNGSQVFPVYVTNGDYQGIGSERIREALNCCRVIGIPEENVYFLGYGDQWDDNSPHIYNATGDEVIKSYVGFDRTYGIESHHAFHDGVLYTNNNYENDIKSIILEKKPDVIFVSDYDSHADHRAVSMAFEKVMGAILKCNMQYYPVVYKGYAYRTAWNAEDDFFQMNILSTKSPANTENEISVYDWNSRIRLPVGNRALSRSIFQSSVYNELSCHASQFALSRISCILNGDKVFWQRRTDSVLYDAEISVSSGDKRYLNDFMLLENDNVKDTYSLPFAGAWIPDNKDGKKTISIKMQNKSNISEIVIYDHPDTSQNITQAEIEFDDGTIIMTGALNSNGAQTIIPVNKANVNSFTIRILATEGNNPGIAEVEAFAVDSQIKDTYMKIQDLEENFVYDYIANDEISMFTVYSNNTIPELNKNEYDCYCDNSRCSCSIKNNQLVVKCPINEKCEITVRNVNSELEDTIVVRNPGWISRVQLSLGLWTDQSILFPLRLNGGLRKMNTFKFFQDMRHLFQ